METVSDHDSGVPPDRVRLGDVLDELERLILHYIEFSDLRFP